MIADPNLPKRELAGRLQKLMFLRLLVVSILLGVSIFLQIRQTRTYFGDVQTAHYFLIGTTYFFTFIYIVLFKLFKGYTKQAYFQLVADTLLVTAIIYSTGGMESIFTFLYIFTIINGSIMLYRRGGVIIASCSSLLYGLLIDLQYFNLINPIGSRIDDYSLAQNINIIYLTVLNIAAFYVVAFLTGYATELVRMSNVELKAKEDDIIKLEALNDWIIRSMTSGLISIDEQDRITLFNPAAERIFGIRAEDVTGVRLAAAIPFLKGYMEGKAEDRKYDNAGHDVMDLQYHGKDGRKLYLRFFISPLMMPGGDRRGQILFFQDITELRRIEDEMKKVEGLALTGELAAGIAHEIRNPMASISGSIQILKDDFQQNDVNRRLMDIILREINRLNVLVNDFLLFARPKSVDFREINLNQLIAESVELFKNSAKWNHWIDIEIDISKRINLVSDPDQIKQVLWNILLNAADAISEGGVIHISADMDDENPAAPKPGEKAVKIIVRDSGAGFTESALASLFTPFFTTKEGGSGLGLAIVNRIIGGLKGKVSGRNHPDGGAEITILLRKEI